MLLRLHRQPDQPNVVLPLEDTSRQVVLVPRGHNEDDFRPGSETGLQCVLPLAPQLLPVDGAVRLFPVFNGVVDDEQIRRVSRDAGHDTAGNHAPPAVCQFKLCLRPDAARFQAKKGAAELLHLLQVLPSEPFGRVVVVTGLDDPVFGIPPQIPAGKALRDGNRLPALRRGFDNQDVVGVPCVCLHKPLDLIGQEIAHAGPLPGGIVNVVQVSPVAAPRQLPSAQLPGQVLLVGKASLLRLRRGGIVLPVDLVQEVRIPDIRYQGHICRDLRGLDSRVEGGHGFSDSLLRDLLSIG